MSIRFEKTLLKPTPDMPYDHEVVDVELTPGIIYYVTRRNGKEFSAMYVGRDRNRRAVFQSSNDHVTWLDDGEIQSISPVRV
jgi:hypothetical protein